MVSTPPPHNQGSVTNKQHGVLLELKPRYRSEPELASLPVPPFFFIILPLGLVPLIRIPSHFCVCVCVMTTLGAIEPLSN